MVRLGAKEELDHEASWTRRPSAAWYSKARGEAVIDVRYTRAKHLRKPKRVASGDGDGGGRQDVGGAAGARPRAQALRA